MLCQFKRLIYPRSIPAGNSSYMIAVYKPCEAIQDSLGNLLSEFKAVGYCLPTAENLRYNMKGHWSRSAKHGVQFEVDTYDEVIAPTKAGIIAYLTSGQINPNSLQRHFCGANFPIQMIAVLLISVVRLFFMLILKEVIPVHI